jgi:hypothetical protein
MITELRDRLRKADWIQDSFAILAAITYYVNNPSYEHEGRELIIRALEYRDKLSGEERKMLYALARQAGLFP